MITLKTSTDLSMANMKIIFNKDEDSIFVRFFSEERQVSDFEEKYWHIPDEDFGVLRPSIYFGYPRDKTQPKVPLEIELSNVSKYMDWDHIILEVIDASDIKIVMR